MATDIHENLPTMGHMTGRAAHPVTPMIFFDMIGIGFTLSIIYWLNSISAMVTHALMVLPTDSLLAPFFRFAL